MKSNWKVVQERRRRIWSIRLIQNGGIYLMIFLGGNIEIASHSLAMTVAVLFPFRWGIQNSRTSLRGGTTKQSDALGPPSFLEIASLSLAMTILSLFPSLQGKNDWSKLTLKAHLIPDPWSKGSLIEGVVFIVEVVEQGNTQTHFPGDIESTAYTG